MTSNKKACIVNVLIVGSEDRIPSQKDELKQAKRDNWRRNDAWRQKYGGLK